MQYRQNDWSILGFGCMRLPRKGANIDLEETEKLIRYAIRNGVNYYDTAYAYPGSEKALGTLMAKNGWRSKMVIATKMPHYLIRDVKDLEQKFQEQLDRLQTDYIDNYLMHMLPDVTIWNKLIDMGVRDWLEEKKAVGKIRRIGFSYHGNTENLIKLLDAYDWEFCQVQYNYMDEFSQAGRAGVRYAFDKGIPVIIMEPLRGGRLVNDLPDKAKSLFAAAEPKRSPAEWGLRWLWDQPQVAVVLSGMGSRAMVRENIRIAAEAQTGELTARDLQLFEEVKAAINEKMKVPCTGCGYCQPCPFGVDIPGSFRCYNVSYTDNFFVGFKEYIMTTTLHADRTNAGLCRKCGRCEQHCPQGIEIRKELDHVRSRLENPAYKAADLVIRRLFKKK